MKKGNGTEAKRFCYAASFPSIGETCAAPAMTGAGHGKDEQERKD
jgi:hypothetical protein